MDLPALVCLTYCKANMRKLPLLLVILAGALLLGPGNSTAQNPAPVASQFSGQSVAELKALSSLIGEVQAQQRIIAENQTLIDERLATLTETLRTARIFVSRGGGKAK